MRTDFSYSRFLGRMALLLAATCGAAAAPLDTGSPFLPSSGAQSNAAQTAGAPIELHGYMVTPEGETFSIYDPAKKSAAWVKVNETGYSFVVRSHKIVNSTDQITVEYEGTTLTLALKQSKIASAAAAGGGLGAGGFGFAGRAGGGGGFGPRGGGGQGQAGVPAAAAIPTAEEVTRLQAAAADFQQRQALRQQQAALQAGQPQQALVPGGQRGNGGQQNGGQGNGGVRRAQRTQGGQ